MCKCRVFCLPSMESVRNISSISSSRLSRTDKVQSLPTSSLWFWNRKLGWRAAVSNEYLWTQNRTCNYCPPQAQKTCRPKSLYIASLFKPLLWNFFTPVGFVMWVIPRGDPGRQVTQIITKSATATATASVTFILLGAITLHWVQSDLMTGQTGIWWV